MLSLTSIPNASVISRPSIKVPHRQARVQPSAMAYSKGQSFNSFSLQKKGCQSLKISLRHPQRTSRLGQSVVMAATQDSATVAPVSAPKRECNPLPMPMGNKHLNVALVFSSLFNVVED